MIAKREQTTEKTENALRIVNQNEMQAKQIVGGPESRAEKGPAFAARVYGPAVRLSQKETTKFTSSRKSIIFILDSKSPALHVHSESELLLIKDWLIVIKVHWNDKKRVDHRKGENNQSANQKEVKTQNLSFEQIDKSLG